MIVFLISIYDVLKAQICDFIKERLRDYSVRQDASKRTVATSAGEVWFVRKTLTSIKLEATLGEKIDLCISGLPEELNKLNEREAKLFLISSLMKQVLNSPNKSTMIADLIKNYAQKIQQESITLLYHIKIQKFMPNTWQLGTVSKILDRVQTQRNM